MAVKFRVPGLQVPADVTGETLAFFNALKERLELIGGERGDPEQRSVSLRELKEAGVIKVQNNNRSARISAPSDKPDEDTEQPPDQALDFSIYPLLKLGQAPAGMQLLAQGTGATDRFRLLLRDFLTLFARVDQESAVNYPWSFEADDYGFAITGNAPAFRFVELAEESDNEPSLPADTSIWELKVDGGELSIDLVNDEETTRVRVACLVRNGLLGALLNIQTDSLQHKGSEVVSRADIRQAEVDLGSPARRSGKFTINDSRIVSSSVVLMTLSPGPYIGKGTRADETEMYPGIVFAAAPVEGGATVYWSAPHRMRGHIKVNYLIG